MPDREAAIPADPTGYRRQAVRLADERDAALAEADELRRLNQRLASDVEHRNAEVEHLRHAIHDADKMADDPTTARAILRAALLADFD